MSTPASTSLICLDGAAGGGQILRTAFAFSALYNTPVQLTNIRATRTPSGFRPQHLASVTMLVDWASQGGLPLDVQGASVGSTSCTFLPTSTITAPSITEVDIGTAGSCTLQLQTALPLLFVSPQAEVRMKVKGGTDVPFSPVADFYQYVFFPFLHKHMNVTFSCQVHRRGYYPKGQGVMEVALRHAEHPVVAPLVLLDRGDLTHVDVYIVMSASSKPAMMHVATKESEAQLKSTFGETIPLHVHKSREEATDVGGGSVLFVMNTSTGCQLTSQAVFEKSFVDVKRIATAVQELLEDCQTGSCVDRHMQDQMLVWMSMCEKESTVYLGSMGLTEHSTSAIDTIQAMTKAVFVVDVEKKVISCQGVPPMK